MSFFVTHTHRYPEEGCKNVLLLLTCGTAGGPDQPAGRKDGPEAASAYVSTGRPAVESPAGTSRGTSRGNFPEVPRGIPAGTSCGNLPREVPREDVLREVPR